MRHVYHLLKIPVLIIFFITATSIKTKAQTLWGMSPAGGGKNGGGNIFSLNTDGTAFNERYAFLADGSDPSGQRMLDYGDGYLYGVIPTRVTGTGLLYRMSPDGTNYQVLYNFQAGAPTSGVIKGADGYLYGTLSAGGASAYGNVYKIGNFGTGFQVLHSFTGSDGSSPTGELLYYGGVIYGTTEAGGVYGKGVMYSIHTDGTAFTIMHSFNGTNGATPNGGLVVIASRGSTDFYGTTYAGGFNNLGVIYTVQATTLAYQDLYNFVYTMGNPTGSLLKYGTTLYGTTKNQGSNGGIMYSYTPSTGNITAFHPFTYDVNGGTVQRPNGILLMINNVLYGSTELGGSFKDGVLFKINPDGTGYQVIHEQYDANGYSGNLIFYGNQIYGLTEGGQLASGLSNGTIYRLNTDGTGFQQLHSFNSTNGYGPSGSLIHATDGNLYGLTTYGGSGYSNGVAFSIKTDGTAYNPVQWVDNGPATGNPHGSLIQGTDGNFYGLNATSGPSWAGSVFKLVQNPLNYQQFYPFCHGPGCASLPAASLIQGFDGYLYGMTPTSGQSGTKGVIFRINTGGTGYQVLHTFAGSTADGASPTGSLIQSPDGMLYGMTANGGASDFGTIFKMKPEGAGFQIVFQFGGSTSGSYGIYPAGSLLLGTDGMLYGMTNRGGSYGYGTIFRVNTNGTGVKLLYNFNGNNGAYPFGSLVQDAGTGLLYGMAYQGGVFGAGTIFKLNPDGTGFVKLLDFNGTNGKNPRGDLLLLPAAPLRLINSPGPVKATIAVDNSVLVETAPNPVQNSFVIHFKKPLAEKLYYSLTDMNGKIIKQNTLQSPAGDFLQQIEVAGLPAGVYVLKAGIGNRQFIKKIVKQ